MFNMSLCATSSLAPLIPEDLSSFEIAVLSAIILCVRGKVHIYTYPGSFVVIISVNYLAVISLNILFSIIRPLLTLLDYSLKGILFILRRILVLLEKTLYDTSHTCTSCLLLLPIDCPVFAESFR